MIGVNFRKIFYWILVVQLSIPSTNQHQFWDFLRSEGQSNDARLSEGSRNLQDVFGKTLNGDEIIPSRFMYHSRRSAKHGTGRKGTHYMQFGASDGIINNEKLAKLFKSISNRSEKRKSKVCGTQECRYIAQEFLKNMNKSVDPCDNFYEYACGRWYDNHKIPEGEYMWSNWQIVNKHIQTNVRGILKEDINSDDIMPLKLAKKWYRSCMDLESIEKRGISPIISILELNGGWPLTMLPKEWNENDYPWQTIDEYYVKLAGASAFYQPGGDLKPNSTDIELTLYPPDLPMSKGRIKTLWDTGDMYESKEYADFIKEIAIDIAEERGSPIEEEKLDEDIKNMLKLQNSIKKLKESSSSKFRVMTIEEFQTTGGLIPENLKIKWLRIFENYLSPGNVNINESYHVGISHIDFMQKLTRILQKSTKRTIVNYIHWYFISNVIQFTTEKFRQKHTNLAYEKFDIEISKSREKYCASTVAMPVVLAYSFIQRYFPERTRKTVIEMIGNIQQVAIKRLLESKWLDFSTKAILVEKVTVMNKTVGYTEMYKNATLIQNYYHGLTINRMHFENMLNYATYKRRRALVRDEYSVQEDPVLNPLLLNALYVLGLNMFIITAADLQPPLFNVMQPYAMNFAFAGSVIAHEITHSFDPWGIRMDKNGRSIKWAKEMINNYIRRSECYVKQYGEYTINISNSEIITIDGNQTLNENIADSIGMQTAFLAYQETLEDNDDQEDLSLPGLEDFTSEQLFFLSYANLWCGVIREDFLKIILELDPHSLFPFRVIGALSNSADFAKAFECPIGSKMNPEEKCSIWK